MLSAKRNSDPKLLVPSDGDESSEISNCESKMQPITDASEKVLRGAANRLRQLRLVWQAARLYAEQRGGWHRALVTGVVRSLKVLWKFGPRGLKHRILTYTDHSTLTLPLQNQFTPAQAELCQRYAAYQPLVSIVVPVYRVDPKWLNLCVQSVVNQYYQNWELILVDDCSQQPALTKRLMHWAADDKRIRVITLKQNQNISGATNVGIDAATGDFIGFLDHDDEITPDALTWFLIAHNQNPDAQWFYSDEATIDEDGCCKFLTFKPDFSPEYLLSVMYTCHFSVYSSELIRQVGGMRLGFDGSQDHDLALRISEKIHRNQVVHIPRVLYKWRALPTSTAASTETKPYAAITGKKAVEEALERRGLVGTVESSPFCPTMYQIHLEPQVFPDVTIIIPTKNGLNDVRKCINSIRCHTEYPHYEIVVIDNQSDD